MTPFLLSGSANPQLSKAIGEILGVLPTACERMRFPDGELQVKVGPMDGGDVYIVQPTGPSVNDHLVEVFVDVTGPPMKAARSN
jgi:ribose-phosphate pyrophosphokinase